MSHRRQVWETLGNLLTRVEDGMETRPALEKLREEVRKLGRAQFKANLLAEDQSASWEQALDAIRGKEEQRQEITEALADERAAAARRELLEAVLPAMDGIDRAMASGRRYLQVRDRASEKPNLTSEEAILVSPADRAVLSGWLDGLRLVRERLLAILEAGDVTPIPTLGHPFDPYLHVAAGTTSEGHAPPGTIVAEERRGYRTPDGVLRYAEVIVSRPKSDGRHREVTLKRAGEG